VITASPASNDLYISQAWNLVLYATTVPSQRLVSLFPNTEIPASTEYISAGYVAGSLTEISNSFLPTV